MRRIISFVLVLFITQIVSSQTIRVSIEPGYGFYDLGKLHQMQDVGMKYYPGFGIKPVEKFPSSFNLNGSILWYATPNFLIGLSTGYLSTRGISSVNDHPGEYTQDVLVHANLYGLEIEYNLQLMHKLKYYLNLKEGRITSTLDLHETFIMSNKTLMNNHDKISENNLFIEPSTGVLYFLNKSVSVSAGIGYLVDLGAYNDSSVNWSGCELKLGVAYSF